MLSPVEIGVVAVVVILLFGTRKLPELGSGLGKAISNFKKSYREASEIDVTPQGGNNGATSSSKPATEEQRTEGPGSTPK
jgi:sec-independent protein translocase protein TatA